MVRNMLILLVLLPAGVTAGTPDWTGYDQLLKEYVEPASKAGLDVNLVDYSGLRNDTRFEVLVDTIREFPVDRLENDNERLAFYINAYNILTMRLILDHWPVDSIKDIGGFFSGPWDIVVLKNADSSLTLDNIEHDIIRSIPEPRIHFAVNCASLSCPDLRREAYRADRLHEQLEDQTRRFLRQDGKGLSVDGDRVKVSRIFDWYEEDFDRVGGVTKFVQRIRPDLEIEGVRAKLTYNWALNGQ
ncbi:MAG: DUF547 domain-containing protein [Pseudomonadales bacterium]